MWFNKKYRALFVKYPCPKVEPESYQTPRFIDYCTGNIGDIGDAVSQFRIWKILPNRWPVYFNEYITAKKGGVRGNVII